MIDMFAVFSPLSSKKQHLTTNLPNGNKYSLCNLWAAEHRGTSRYLSLWFDCAAADAVKHNINESS